jgi:lysophospholipase L1-like esterase
VIISLGSNDLKNLNTEQELVNLRKRVVAKRVYWVLPANKPHKQEVVKRIAHVNGDIVLPIKHVSKDNVHPTPQGYKDLANSIK